MGVYGGPNVVENGLVLALDAGNSKSYDFSENLYPHGETLQSLSNTRCTRETFSSGGPFNRGYVEFTTTETSEGGIYNFDSGNTISLVSGQVITFSVYFKNISLSGGIYLRCWTGSGRAWTTQRQVIYNLTDLTSSVSTGTIISHSITNEGNGWYRLSMTIAADQNGFSAISINVGSNTIGQKYQASSLQVESRSFLTSYTITTGTAKLRSNFILDISNNLNNGTLVNGVGYSGDNGGSLSFDGVDDGVNCGNNSSLNVGNNITANAWFYVNSIALYQAILGKVTSDFGLGWELANSSGTFRTTFRPSGTQINLQIGSLSVGNWYMGTMTYDNTTARLYLNGVQTGSTTSGGPVTLNSTEPLTIGRRVQGNFYNGNIAQVSIYNRALTAQEIQQNFIATKSRFGL